MKVGLSLERIVGRFFFCCFIVDFLPHFFWQKAGCWEIPCVCFSDFRAAFKLWLFCIYKCQTNSSTCAASTSFFLHNLKEISAQGSSVSEHLNSSSQSFSFCFLRGSGNLLSPWSHSEFAGTTDKSVMWCNYFYTTLLSMELQIFKINCSFQNLSKTTWKRKGLQGFVCKGCI